MDYTHRRTTMAENIFKEDEETKAMLLEISSLFGVKVEIVRQVWQFTVISIMLRVAETDVNRLTRFILPYIGTVGIKNNGTLATNKGIEPDLDVFLNLSDTFKNLLFKSQDGNYKDLSNYIQKKYIDSTVNNINQS